MTIRILLVDTCTVLRHGLRLILEEEPTFTVVGEAANGKDALILLERLVPTVIILDPALSELADPNLLCDIQATSAQSKLIILSNAQQSANIIQAFRFGAKGYLHKSVTGAELIQAIYQVVAGDCILPTMLTNQLISGLVDPPPTLSALTDRERDVLGQVTQGLGNKEIAIVLSISENTVKTHMRRILAKLNLRSRTEAATYALNQGLVADPNR